MSPQETVIDPAGDYYTVWVDPEGVWLDAGPDSGYLTTDPLTLPAGWRWWCC